MPAKDLLSHPWPWWFSTGQWEDQWTRWPAPQSWFRCPKCRAAPPETGKLQIWWSVQRVPPETACYSRTGYLRRHGESRRASFINAEKDKMTNRKAWPISQLMTDQPKWEVNSTIHEKKHSRVVKATERIQIQRADSLLDIASSKQNHSRSYM